MMPLGLSILVGLVLSAVALTVLLKGSPAQDARFAALPRTAVGWTAFGLALAGVAVFALNPLGIMPNTAFSFAAPMAVGLFAGAFSVLALTRAKERSFLLYVSLVPALLVIAFIVGEVAFPH